MAREAEELGFDAFWQRQEQFEPHRFLGSAPLNIASGLATTTSRLQVGLAVLQLSLDHPLRHAQDIATVDQISRSRLVVGVGRGGYDYPYRARTKISYRQSIPRN